MSKIVFIISHDVIIPMSFLTVEQWLCVYLGHSLHHQPIMIKVLWSFTVTWHHKHFFPHCGTATMPPLRTRSSSSTCNVQSSITIYCHMTSLSHAFPHCGTTTVPPLGPPSPSSSCSKTIKTLSMWSINNRNAVSLYAQQHHIPLWIRDFKKVFLQMLTMIFCSYFLCCPYIT